MSEASQGYRMNLFRARKRVYGSDGIGTRFDVIYVDREAGAIEENERLLELARRDSKKSNRELNRALRNILRS